MVVKSFKVVISDKVVNIVDWGEVVNIIGEGKFVNFAFFISSFLILSSQIAKIFKLFDWYSKEDK